MHKCRFTAGVRELAVTRPLHQPADAADVDDARGIARRDVAAAGQKWQERRRHPILCRDVGRERVGPLLRFGLQHVLGNALGRREVGFPGRRELGVVVARDARVVHQKVDATAATAIVVGFSRRHFLREPDAFLLVGHVAREGNDLAGPRTVAGSGAVLFDDFVQRLSTTSRDVHLRAVGVQCLRDHQSNPSPTARHHGCDVRNIEEF